MNTTLKRAGGILGGIAVVAGLVVWGRMDREDRLQKGPGHLSSWVLNDGPTPVYLALETIVFQGEDSDETVWRLTTYDARTGARLARKSEAAWHACASAAPGFVWCARGNDVEVLSVPSLQVHSDAASLKAKVGKTMTNAQQLRTTPEGKLEVTLSDGARVLLDAATLTTEPEPTGAQPRTQSPTYSTLSGCSLKGTERQGLCEWGAQGQVRRDEGEGFLRPEVIGGTPGGGLLLATLTSLDANGQTDVVLLDASLKAVGHAPLGVASQFSFSTSSVQWLGDRTVVIIPSKGTDQSVAIDASKGTLLWSVKH